MTKKHHDGQTQQLEEQINQLHNAAEQKVRARARALRAPHLAAVLGG